MLLLGILGLIASADIQAQTNTTAQTVSTLPDEEAIHQELRGLKKVYEDAVNSGDLKTLAPMFGPQSTGIIALNQEFHTLPEMEKIYEDFMSMLGPDHVYRVSLNPERSLIFGDIAIARGTSDDYIKSKGHEFNFQSHWSAVLRRENGNWRMINLQATMDPFHNSVTDFIMTSIKRVYGGVGLAIGLLLGIALGYLIFGRGKKY